jgi:release factor glutamine methyltransferase
MMNPLLKPFEVRLAAAGSGNPKRAVEELAAHVLGCKPLEIYFKTLAAEQERALEGLVARAEQGEPIQYIIGTVDFRGLEILCDRRALIPRPETELLVEEVLLSTAQSLKPFSVADVCTGTGCVGLALAHELPNAAVTAIDISPAALALATENAERLGLANRFQCLENDLLKGFDECCLDVVVSNPPYILSNVWKMLEPCVRDFEPQLALDGGADGLDLIRPLAEQALRVLKPGGGLFLEFGFDQGAAVVQCLDRAGFEQVRVVTDLAGLDRIAVGLRP